MTDHVNLDPRFDDLPTITLTSYMYPEFDGDMAALHELADRILEMPARLVARLGPVDMFSRTADQLGYTPRLLFSVWDHAGALLEEWRRG